MCLQKLIKFGRWILWVTRLKTVVQWVLLMSLMIVTAKAIAMDFGISLPAQRIIRSLQQIIEWRGKPLALRCHNGPEFISHKLIDWAIKAQIILLYIQPGKPTQNAYIERLNRTARHELLELNLFEDVEHAQLLVTQWQWTYNNIRTHSTIGGVSPRQLL